MHSKVQLLYLLLLFVVGVGVAVLVAKATSLQKCREQNMGLFVGFNDLTKGFDTVNRDGL